MRNEREITISMELYAELLADQKYLNCLEAAGVDDWKGIERANQILAQEFDND